MGVEMEACLKKGFSIWVGKFILLLSNTWVLPLQSLWFAGSVWGCGVSAVLVILMWRVWPQFMVRQQTDGSAEKIRLLNRWEQMWWFRISVRSRGSSPLEIKYSALPLRVALFFPTNKSLFRLLTYFIQTHAILSHGRSCEISCFLNLALTFFLVRLESKQQRPCFYFLCIF